MIQKKGNNLQDVAVIWNRIVSYRQEFFGVMLLASFIFLSLSCLSFNPFDNSPYYFSSLNKDVSNWCGIVGAYVSAVLFHLWGSGTYFFVAFIGFFALLFFKGIPFRYHWDRIIGALLFVVAISSLLAAFQYDVLGIDAGGIVGMFLFNAMKVYVGKAGVIISALATVWISGVMVFHLSFFESLKYSLDLMKRGFVHVAWLLSIMGAGIAFALRTIGEVIYSYKSKNKTFSGSESEGELSSLPEIDGKEDSLENGWEYQGLQEELELKEHSQEKLNDLANITIYDYAHRSRSVFGALFYSIRNSVFPRNFFDACKQQGITLFDQSSQQNAIKIQPVFSPKKPSKLFNLPDVGLFAKQRIPSSDRDVIAEECLERSGKLEEKLLHFGIEGKVTAIHPGPVITSFEYTPAIGTKISKIISLEDDLAMVLRARSIRIIAPIPGRSVVGFEISNERREDVFLSDIVLSKEFKKDKSILPLALGFDTVGISVIEDLYSMPHLLVAGSTGSGKSVGLNSMLMSLLARCRPDDMRLILIDPKRLEFATYRDIPHLLFPIVDDARSVSAVLKWVIEEMESRYEKMAAAGVRNLADYHEYCKKDSSNTPLPFIVIIIDELADLMLVAGKEIEILLTRIAQMARAAGIHMIVATQRPSVDVLTGIIKVNFPSRISYRLSSRVDSKTILDSIGAEKLLGRGDMLCTSANSSELRRVHGAYVSDEEIEKLTDYLRAQQKPQYLDLEAVVWKNSSSTDDVLEDDLYEDVIEYLSSVEEVSISMLQRKYRIGFNRSARIIEQLEVNGLLAPAQGGKPRKVLR